MKPVDLPAEESFEGYPLLAPIAKLYSGVAGWRRRRLSKNPTRLPVPVISVGNITVGGTGKTPVVEFVARMLHEKGWTPGVLSRGYRAQKGSEGRNDEFLVLEENLPDLIQVPNPNRAQGGRAAIEKGAQALVLDDGFQHFQLARDLDLVLIDCVRPFGGGKVLPAGLLRESLETLHLADLFLLTRCEGVSARKLGLIKNYLRWRFPDIPQCDVHFEARKWRQLNGDSERPVDAFKGEKAFGFSGIGNPEAFRRDLLRLGIDLTGWKCFPDHHHYTLEDGELIFKEAERSGAQFIVFTQKDAVKLKSLQLPEPHQWWQLNVGAQIQRGQEILHSKIQRELQSQDEKS